MIDEEATFEKFGYYARDSKPKSDKKVVALCDDCGKVRVVKKARYFALCPSCSRKGEKHPNWKGGLAKRICENCGKEFPVKPSRIKSGRGKFCSRECHSKWRSKHRRGKNSANWQGGKIMRICQTCGTEFPVNPSAIKNGGGKFCSRECMGKFNGGENCPLWQGGKVMRICETCGDVFFVKPSQIKKGEAKFCSHQCRAIAMQGENAPNWKGGISFEPYCHKFNDELKEYIRDKFGRVCFLCDRTEEEEGRKLSVHHVNYNKNCGCDDDETCQFVPLCRSCNAKVNKNRDMWEAKIKAMMKNKLNGWYI